MTELERLVPLCRELVAALDAVYRRDYEQAATYARDLLDVLIALREAAAADQAVAEARSLGEELVTALIQSDAEIHGTADSWPAALDVPETPPCAQPEAPASPFAAEVIAAATEPDVPAVFDAATFADFERRAGELVRENLAWRVKDWDDGRMRESLRYAILRARSFGIRSQADVYAYVHLAVLFGRNFHVDERYPWAVEHLGAAVAVNAADSFAAAAAAAAGVSAAHGSAVMDEMLWRAVGQVGAEEVRAHFTADADVPPYVRGA